MKEESAPGSLIQYVAMMERPTAQSAFSVSRTGMSHTHTHTHTLTHSHTHNLMSCIVFSYREQKKNVKVASKGSCSP